MVLMSRHGEPKPYNRPVTCNNVWTPELLTGDAKLGAYVQRTVRTCIIKTGSVYT